MVEEGRWMAEVKRTFSPGRRGRDLESRNKKKECQFEIASSIEEGRMERATDL